MKTPNFENIKAASEIDLQKHAVIEASAGTGKTYTLIELVMRLLIEQHMRIDKILLVTFTEQATGELKARIRQRLIEALKATDDGAMIDHLEQNISLLNQASIFTIHGFCHGALREFAFEQGAVFEPEVINDSDVWPLVLRQMKRSWPANQALIKQLKVFSHDKSISKVDDLLLQLASKYKSGFDSIYPSSFDFDIEDNIQQIRGLLKIPLFDYEAEFKSLKGLKSTSHQNLWLAVIQPFLSDLHSLIRGNDNNDIEAIIQLFSTHFASKADVNEVFFKSCPAAYKVEHNKSVAVENRALAVHFFKLIDALNQIWEAISNHQKVIKFSAIAPLLNELIQVSQQYKLERGLISYDDMILRLWQQLIDEQALPMNEQLLTQALRQKYQVAIIDEFQDTDIRQWEIFKLLFLKIGPVDSVAEWEHRLWVIGDPKQAIYGFRGADIHTYEAAKGEITSCFQGMAYRLNTNYRTVEGLIREMNRFFADDTTVNSAENSAWFDADAVCVEVPDEKTIDINKMPQMIDNKGLNAFNCLSVKQSDSGAVKTQLATKIASTIKHQIINQVEVSLKGVQRTLDASDVCILVRSNSDAEYIEVALQQMQIPFTFHKKKNLYQSIEAIHFQVLLTALAMPNDIKRVNNALLTLFFALQPNQLADFAEENLPTITALWLKIKEAVIAKDWIKVFDYLLSESGAMYRARNNRRRIANLKQLKQLLLKAALQNNLGAESLAKFFQQKREQTSSDEDLHHKDTEQKAVKIMTMHISKGLEFPVVFLFGGFGQGPADQFLQYYDETQKGMVYDLVKQNQKTYDEQQLKQAHQLYYVAMTRAIFMLFLPYVDESDCKISKPGWYVKTVMARLLATGMYQQTPAGSCSFPTKSDVPDKSNEVLSDFNLIVPTQLYRRRRNLHSFSSLSHYKNHASLAPIANDFSQNLTAELMNTEVQINVAEKVDTSPQIPGGVKTGHVLHGIFEHVDFVRINQHKYLTDVYQDDEIMAVIDQQMKLFKLENKAFDESDESNNMDQSLAQASNQPLDYRQQFADWTWHTLKKPLVALDGQNLASIALDNRCHELSFFWNEGNTHLTGFIDLFFSVVNKQEDFIDYYILDWKSNFSANGYSPTILSDEVMTQHQYHWQYQLYAMAMQRWFDALKANNEQMTSARLKGAIYVFSRGIDCQEEAQNGMFFDDFSKNHWQPEDIETELLQIDQFGAKS
ncbi:UvrD-helicase domain-containing protein [Marinicella litoralis]|uniref:RecBCD enzyme subunit RecB n=1 Tax=Marinicella litoralis TaxID=644220 RepID=A0A4R6XGE8_9GAMM|nr:UvrD-helicase domain-containing protein [Marinicella litoralis]TDR18475.1 DNA helicase/exodeoxyribonuclease V beta subunit [Marinicella litoralis]